MHRILITDYEFESMAQYAPISERVINILPRLKAISRHGAGVDNVDVAAATRRGSPSPTCPTTVWRTSATTRSPWR